MKSQPIMKVRNFILAMLMTAVCTPVAFSQADPDSIKYHLSIVTTIGSRFSEPWIQVPLSLSYIPRKELPRGKGYGLDEVLSGIPGVLAQSRYGNQDVRLTIRGYGTRGAGERSNAGTTRGIRVLNNGFPETEPDGRTSFDLVDISGAGGIEVMRSNVSSLYGNASGGVINIMANTWFESPYAGYTQTFGSFGFHKEALNAGARVSDGTMYFSLSNTNADGWRWHSQSTQALLNTGIVASLGEGTDLGIHLAATSNVFRIPGPLSQAQYDANPQQADSLYIKRDERRNNRLGRLGVSVTHMLDDDNMISASTFVQPKYLQRSERGTFRDFNRYHVGGSAMYRNTSRSGDAVKNVLLMGVDEAYQDGAILFYNLTAATDRGTLRDNKREGANNFGLFLQDEIELGAAWGALLGARYDNITYYSQSFVNLKLNDSRTFHQVTPKLGINYQLSPTHSLYANLGGGIEVPAGNETDPSPTYGQDTIYAINPLLEPIRSTTVEVGTKQMLRLGDGEPVANLS
jgi:iron complex outermembrane receptor protein